jgi:aspartyl/asparaginyl-tRNA synthetase
MCCPLLAGCRAENSYTHRHLCEFTGLDFEMTINEHYFEVLDVIEGLFETIFNGLATQYGEQGMPSNSDLLDDDEYCSIVMWSAP